jgi:hypothetical protein
VDRVEKLRIGPAIIEQGSKISISAGAAAFLDEVTMMFLVGGAAYVFLNGGRIMRVLSRGGTVRGIHTSDTRRK